MFLTIFKFFFFRFQTLLVGDLHSSQKNGLILNGWKRMNRKKSRTWTMLWRPQLLKLDTNQPPLNHPWTSNLRPSLGNREVRRKGHFPEYRLAKQKYFFNETFHILKRTPQDDPLRWPQVEIELYLIELKFTKFIKFDEFFCHLFSQSFKCRLLSNNYFPSFLFIEALIGKYCDSLFCIFTATKNK